MSRRHKRWRGWPTEQPNRKPVNRPASIPRDELALTPASSSTWKPKSGPTKATVRKVACPACGASPGEPCQGRRGDRASNHADRVAASQLERNRRRLVATDTNFTRPRTDARTRPTEEVSRGAVSLDSDEAGATMRESLGR